MNVINMKEIKTSLSCTMSHLVFPLFFIFQEEGRNTMTSIGSFHVISDVAVILV